MGQLYVSSTFSVETDDLELTSRNSAQFDNYSVIERGAEKKSLLDCNCCSFPVESRPPMMIIKTKIFN